MKTILIDYKIFNLNSPGSAGFISGLKLLQSKGCKLYIGGAFKNLNPLILKVLKSEKISIKGKDEKITYDFTIKLKGKSLLSINNETKLKSFDAAAEFIVSEFRFTHVI